MALISSWIANIILLILFATILELMLPNSSTHRYVKLVIGLMILMAMLQPVLSLFQEDPEVILQEMVQWDTGIGEEEWNFNELEKSDIESEQLAYISEQVAVQLKSLAEEPLLEEFNKHIVSLDISFESLYETEETDTTDNLTNVHVVVQDVPPEPSGETNEKIDIKVESIEITGNYESYQTEEELEGHIEMIDRLSEIWEIPEGKITIQDKGGNLID